jgi:hypothetical protein
MTITLLIIKWVLLVTGGMVLLALTVFAILTALDHQVDDWIDEENKDQKP